eukprot:15326185-Ditylum_brightwellii.AAC.3
MLVGIGMITAAQAHGTEATSKAVVHLLNYYATHPNAILCFNLSEKEAWSRAGGYFLMGNRHDNQFNGPVHITLIVLHNVMASTAEAELGASFENAKEAAPMCVALTEMGHPQPTTPIQVDNSTAHRIVNRNIRQ